MESDIPALEDLFQSHCSVKKEPHSTTKFSNGHSGFATFSGMTRRGHRAGKFVIRRPNTCSTPRPPPGTPPAYIGKHNNKEYPIFPHATCLLVRKDNNKSYTTDVTAVGAAENSRSDTNGIKSNSVQSYSQTDSIFKKNVESKTINSERNPNNNASKKNNEDDIRSINNNGDSRQSNRDVLRRHINNVSKKDNMNLVNSNDSSSNSKNNNGRRWDSGDHKFNKSSSRYDFGSRYKKFSSTNSNTDSATNRSKSGPSCNNGQRSQSYHDSNRKTDGAQSNSNVTKCSHFDLVKFNTDSKQSTSEHLQNSTFKARDYYNKYENRNRRTKNKKGNWKSQKESIWNENFVTEQCHAPNKPTIWTFHPSCTSFRNDEDQQQAFVYDGVRTRTTLKLSPRETEYRPKCTTSVYSDENFELIDDVNPGDQFKPCEPSLRKTRIKNQVKRKFV